MSKRNFTRDAYIVELVNTGTKYDEIQGRVKERFGKTITKGRISQIKSANMVREASAETFTEDRKEVPKRLPPHPIMAKGVASVGGADEKTA